MEQNIRFMLCKILLGIPCLAVGGIYILGFDVVDDVRFHHGNFGHAFFRRLYSGRKIVVFAVADSALETKLLY